MSEGSSRQHVLSSLKQTFGRTVGGQFARPHGPLGRVVARIMRRGNAPLNRWVVGLLDPQPTNRILEVGFGPGVALADVLLRVTDGHVAAVDASTSMVSEARSRHAAAVAAGRLDVREGDAAALPYDDETFDKVFGTHVLYFWPDQVAALKELRRVLRPSGVLALGYQERERMPPQARAALEEAGATLVGSADVERLARAAGYADVRVETKQAPDGPAGFCAIATR